MSKQNTATIRFEPMRFMSHTKPIGYLPDEPGAQALWWYSVVLMQQIKRQKEVPLYEGELDSEAEPRAFSLFRAAARIYGVDIETLHRYWPAVDKEMARYNTEKLNKSKGVAVGLMIDIPMQFRFIPVVKVNTH
jgi:hypothetical protein